MKQIREICCLYEASPALSHGGHAQRGGGAGSHNTSSYRQEVIERLQNQHSLVILVTNSLTDYLERVRAILVENPKLDPAHFYPDRRYNHLQQVQERLNFLRFLLKPWKETGASSNNETSLPERNQDGQLWLCADQAKQIWQCLAEQAAFPTDREACFKWFSKLMGDEPDLDPSINRQFFENNVLQLDPALLTESGMKCFERFFKAVNSKEGKLKAKRRAFLMDDVDLIGTDYIWRVVTCSGEEIAHRAIELLKEVNTNLGPRLQANVLEFHESFISECMDRLRAHYDTVSVLRKEMDETSESAAIMPSRRSVVFGEANKLCRVMQVLHEYVAECDGDFAADRKILPLHRACRGKHLSLLVRFSNPGRPLDDVEVSTHSNDTLGALRRQVLRRIKASPQTVKLDLFLNGELLDTGDDRKLLAHIPLRDKTLLNGKLCQQSSNMPSSPDTSSDSSTSSPHHPDYRVSSDAENSLPGLMSQQAQYAQFFFQLADLGLALGHAHLRDAARNLLQLMPADTHTMLAGNEIGTALWQLPLINQATTWRLPDVTTVKATMRLAWAASSGGLQALHNPLEQLHARMLEATIPPPTLPDHDDVLVCREALEVLTVGLMLHPQCLDLLTRDKLWHAFIIDLLLLCPSRAVRAAAADQFLLVSTWCTGSQQPLQFCITLLFTLLCRLLNYAYVSNCPLPTAETLLNNEIAWLKQIRENVRETGDSQCEDAVLEGHLGLARELLSFVSPEKKHELGCQGGNLIRELVEDFVFPASHLMAQLWHSGELPIEAAVPVCQSPPTVTAAFELLVALCVCCVPNMRLLVSMITDMFYSDREEPLTEWDYMPPVGPRPVHGFVGLKNAGATCYMNSVLQQLYMVESIRVGLLAAEGAATDLTEDFSGEERNEVEGCLEAENESDRGDMEEGRREYNIGILKQVQAIFGHLAYSKLQYYVPRGLLQGEPVNLREQQDAVEFFMSLVESLDEALKALRQEQVMGKVLGGSYSDQKICKGCPHRYSKEEPFSVISVDIRNHSNLLDSLEQYVKGELLEGADAYHCEKCNAKVVTVKRLCVKKLPPILAIQLKRFEYDYERVCAIKFNDYFEFPRDLDMDPYTECAYPPGEPGAAPREMCTRYQLSGIVVHSGQASGGHYYSYILHRQPDGTPKWYKFDDGDVTECKMDDPEEMKTQCFGGEYMGEVFDHMLKRMSYRRQKRWWNAYMLFYTRLDVEMNALTRKYFQFMRRLITCNNPPNALAENLSPEAEELSLLSVQLAARFLFHTGLHTKKTLRGPATDWYEAMWGHLRHSRQVRHWFAHAVLFSHPHSPEVRSAFTKIIVFIAHCSHQDGPCPSPLITGTGLVDPNATLSDHLLHAVLLLLHREVADHGRHLPHYFSLFHSYALLGLNVPALFMAVAVDEGPGPAIKYQYPELTKLHQVVSLLIRCCDVSSKTQSSQSGMSPLPNPYYEPLCPDYIMPIQQAAQDQLFGRIGYLKKLIEDSTPSEDTVKLLQFCCWENPHFSRSVLAELLWQVAYAYCHELRHHMELLLAVLLIEDSWQTHRIHNALKGVPEEREGLFETIVRSKTNYQKRAYQCIKLLVSLFYKCRNAHHLLCTNQDIKRRWATSVDWLQDELERRPYPANPQYSYSNWSPPAQSNDTTNGYFLERSNSARKTLEKAIELLPEVEQEAEVMSEEGESSPQMADETPPTPQQQQQGPPVNFMTVNTVAPSSGSFSTPYVQQVQQQSEEWSESSSSQKRAVPVQVTTRPHSETVFTSAETFDSQGNKWSTSPTNTTNITHTVRLSSAPSPISSPAVVVGGSSSSSPFPQPAPPPLSNAPPTPQLTPTSEQQPPPSPPEQPPRLIGPDIEITPSEPVVPPDN
ncbi:hypothetical protein B566_EDAN017868 [Ephemera danica]|nr:hypothetical protein B566_EDAN017868 [Ephemera danica]